MKLEFNMGALLIRTLSNMGPNLRRFAGADKSWVGPPNLGYFYPMVLEMTELYCFLGATTTCNKPDKEFGVSRTCNSKECCDEGRTKML